MPGLAGNFEKYADMKKAKGKKAMPAKMKAKMPMKGKGMKGGKVPMRGSALEPYGD